MKSKVDGLKLKWTVSSQSGQPWVKVDSLESKWKAWVGYIRRKTYRHAPTNLITDFSENLSFKSNMRVCFQFYRKSFYLNHMVNLLSILYVLYLLYKQYCFVRRTYRYFFPYGIWRQTFTFWDKLYFCYQKYRKYLNDLLLQHLGIVKSIEHNWKDW